MKHTQYLPHRLFNNIENIIDIPLGINKELLRVMAYTIFRCSVFNVEVEDEDEDDFVQISKTLFESAVGERKIGNKKLYTVLLDTLERENIIEIKRNAYSGQRCNSFRIKEDQFDDEVGKLHKYEISEEYLNKKIKKNIIESEKDETEDKRKKRLFAPKGNSNHIKSMKYDYNAAIDYLKYIYDNKIPNKKGLVLTAKTMTDLELKLKLLKKGNTDEKERTVSVLQTNGRINTCISDLRSDFRQFIIGDDLFILDITNSQPLLSNVLISHVENPLSLPSGLKDYLSYIFNNTYSYYRKFKVSSNNVFEKISKIPLPTRVQATEFKNLCESGNFYEYIMDWFWQNDYEKYDKNDLHIRDNMKRKLFTMFYSDYSSVEFNKVFSSINKFIDNFKQVFIEYSDKNGIKEKKARMFAIVLQAVESYIWVQTIHNKLDELGIKYYGIHDSVIVEAADKETVKRIIMNTYSQYGLNPNIDEKRNNFTLIGYSKTIPNKKRRQGIEGLFS